MRNIYVVRLNKSVRLEVSPLFGSRDTTHLYVVASSFEGALAAVVRKHPGIEVRGIELVNYTGVPIVSGE